MAVEYKIVTMIERFVWKNKGFSESEMEEHFNDMASQGYSFVRYIPVVNDGTTLQLHFIFEKKDG
jgi:hypothetical protein